MLFCGTSPVSADTIVANSCSTADVQTAINAAIDGDTVMIPDGSCTWTTGISTTKQIWIRAQNYTPTPHGPGQTCLATRNVTLTHNASIPLFNMTSGNSFHVAISGIAFLQGTGTNNYMRFDGSGSKVPLVSDIYAEIEERFGDSPDAQYLAFLSKGGVMWNTCIRGVGAGCCGGGLEGPSFLINSPVAWETASTEGVLDTNGDTNFYIEDCDWKDFGQSPDVDQRARVVVRHSLLDGVSGVMHGFTSGNGNQARHVEYYDNVLRMTTNPRNINRGFWVRAGTAIFTDNDVDMPNQGFGDPGFVDFGDNVDPPGAYPVDYQVGRGHNGTSHIADPVYIWNNIGTDAGETSVQPNWTTHIQLDRDYFVNTSGGGAGAKPGYSKFTYPHPFRAVLEGGDLSPPTDPSNLSATAVSGTQINLSWTASTDDTGVVEYRIERCSGAACSNFSQIDTVTGVPPATTYNDTGLSDSTLYRYRVRATDAVPNISGYSNIAEDTTDDTTAPTDPSALSATAISTSQINLSWSASSDAIGVVEYRIKRCSGAACTPTTQIDTVTGAPPSTTYSDTGLTAATLYRYSVSAADAIPNVSGESNIAEDTTVQAALSFFNPPTNLTVSAGGGTVTFLASPTNSTVSAGGGTTTILNAPANSTVSDGGGTIVFLTTPSIQGVQ